MATVVFCFFSKIIRRFICLFFFSGWLGGGGNQVAKFPRNSVFSARPRPIRTCSNKDKLAKNLRTQTDNIAVTGAGMSGENTADY